MEGFRCLEETRVEWRDLDGLGHVNNATYSSYLEIGRFGYFVKLGMGAMPQGLILAELTLQFRSPAFLYEQLVIGSRVTEIRNSSFIMESHIWEKATERLVLTSRAVLVHYDYTENRAKTVPPEWREAMARVEGREF